MKEILNFLKDIPTELDTIHTISSEKLKKNYKELIANFPIKTKTKNLLVNTVPRELTKGQIWLCKQEYIDYLGNNVKGDFPYYVVIVENPTSIENFEFVRVQPISIFTQFYAKDELLIADTSITGFEFIIETWNEQPIATNILGTFIGEMKLKKLKIENEIQISDEQKEFRVLEVKNTNYLRQSVNSFLIWKEIKETASCVIFNIDNTPNFVSKSIKEGNNVISEPFQEYLIAAKKGFKDKREKFQYSNTIDNISFTINVIKYDNTFMITINGIDNYKLTNEQQEFIQPKTTNKFEDLDRGIYFLRIDGIDKEIRIILR